MAGATLGVLVACCRCSGVPLAANAAATERAVMPHRAASPPLRAAATPCLRRGGLPALQPQQPWQPLARPVRRRQQHVQPPQALALPEALSALEASPARDFAAAAFAVAGSVALIKFFDTLERMGIIDKKLSRKLVHTLAGPGFLACWPLFGSAPYSRLIATMVPALNGVRLLLIGNGIVKDERAVMAMSRSGDPAELLRGPLYYVIVLMAVTSLYWRGSSVGLVVASLMCGGDGLADIVGRRWGKGNPLPWNPDKSWAGSTAMFLGGLGMSMGLITLFCSLGYFDCDMPSMALTVAGISLVATLVESLPVNQSIDDNLSVPGVAAFLGIMFLQVAALAL